MTQVDRQQEYKGGLDTRRPPAWLARIEIGASPRVYCTVMGLITFLVGAMVSAVLSRWLVLPGVVLALALLTFIAYVTNQRVPLMLPFIFATFDLIVIALFLVQDKALADRGRWVDVVVVNTTQTRSNTTCTVRYPDGHQGDGPWGGCRAAKTGDTIRLFEDPSGEVPPSNTAPNLALWWLLAAGANIVLTATVIRAAARGSRTERRLQAQEALARPTPRYVPPPPPPPAAPPTGW